MFWAAETRPAPRLLSRWEDGQPFQKEPTGALTFGSSLPQRLYTAAQLYKAAADHLESECTLSA